VTDPYAPFPARTAPAFPRDRLVRAGLDDDTVARVESEWQTLDAAGRVEFGRYLDARTDEAIRERFAEGVAGVEQPVAPSEPAATPTYEELNALTVDELDDRLRAWNDEHPEQHLAIAGRKGEKIGRLLDAYEQEASAPAPTAEVSEPIAVATAGTEQPTGGTVAEQQLPTAPVATAPEGAPAAPVVAPGTVETGDASTGAETPAQTADAAGAGTATTEE
jgi:hypothetical protein